MRVKLGPTQRSRVRLNVHLCVAWILKVGFVCSEFVTLRKILNTHDL